jgi:hypothetical protein
MAANSPKISTAMNSTLTRRSALQMTLLGATSALLSRTAILASDANDSGSEKPSSTKTVRVRSVVELSGEVRLSNSSTTETKHPNKMVVESRSTLDFEEQFRLTPNQGKRTASIRLFNEATAESLIGKQNASTSLRNDCRTIYSTVVDGIQQTNCLDVPLTNNERDLVQGVISTMYIDRLLPTGPVKIGQAWDLSEDVIKSLFQLDSVQESKITVRLAEADDKKAQLEIDGQVSGAARGVPTQLTVKGKAQIDRAAVLVSWLAIVIDETREIGNAEPGFKITARIRVLRAPLEKLTADQTLEDIENKVTDLESLQMSEFQSIDGGFRFLAERFWSIMSENQLETVLRLIKQNKIVAQCNITNLVDTEPGKQLTLEGYQADIRQALGQTFDQFLESSESVTESGLRMVRIVTSGEVEQVPVQWINVHLSNDQGRHISLVFSMDAGSAENFAAADSQIAGAFEFQPIPKSDATETNPEATVDKPAQVSQSQSGTQTK